MTRHGLGTYPGTPRILLAGCSAGARGAMFTADYMGGLLASVGVQDAEVTALLDSPLWVDIEPITGADGAVMPLMEQTQQILALMNATDRLGPTCMAAYPEADWWKCLYGQYRMPFLTTPYVSRLLQMPYWRQVYMHMRAVAQSRTLTSRPSLCRRC